MATKKTCRVEYRSNNSGGDWWLTDNDWFALERAGWEVDWVRLTETEDRFLNALATSATREGLTYGEAVAEWEQVVGANANATGCECCGPPHNFYEDNE